MQDVIGILLYNSFIGVPGSSLNIRGKARTLLQQANKDQDEQDTRNIVDSSCLTVLK